MVLVTTSWFRKKGERDGERMASNCKNQGKIRRRLTLVKRKALTFKISFRLICIIFIPINGFLIYRLIKNIKYNKISPISLKFFSRTDEIDSQLNNSNELYFYLIMYLDIFNNIKATFVLTFVINTYYCAKQLSIIKLIHQINII